MNIDVEIYLNQFISFFEKNPNSLIELIGDIDKNEFFSKVKEQCYININNGDDVSLTRTQIIDIIVGLLKIEKKEIIENKTENIFQETSMGKIYLN
jgi:hypothetical protein